MKEDTALPAAVRMLDVIRIAGLLQVGTRDAVRTALLDRMVLARARKGAGGAKALALDYLAAC